MAIAGYKVRLRKSGDSTPVTAEAMTSISATRFQVTTAARRCLDPDVAITVYDGVTPVTPVTIEFEFGFITLPSAPGGAVTFNGSYRPLTTDAQDIAEGTQVSLSLSRDLLDTTVFGAAGVRSRLAGLKDAEIAIDVISSPAAYSSMYFEYASGAQLCLEIDPDGASGSNEALRAWGKIASLERSASVDGLIESSLSFQVSATRGAAGHNPGYAWGTL